MFWLKKFAAFWLMPLSLSLTLLVVGWLLLFSRKWRTLGRWLVGAATALLLLFSNRAFSTWLVRSIENAYPPVPEFVAGAPLPPDIAVCKFVVILGGGHGDTAQFSAVNKLSNSSQTRLMEGLRVLHALPDARLIVSGFGEPGYPSHAAVVAQAAESLGVAPDRIIRSDSPRDTEDESVQLARLTKGQPYALVTSAWHMRRAMALMHHAGMHPVPCPTDYAARPSPYIRAGDFSWDTESLTRSTRAIYEHVGLLWVRLRGKA